MLCISSQGSQAGADERFERKGRCPDLGELFQVAMTNPSFDMFLFDRTQDMTGINENIGEMDHHWGVIGFGTARVGTICSLGEFFFLRTTTMLLLLSINCKAIRLSLEPNTTHPS